MRIALATCRELPDWEVDDRPFHLALEERGVEVHHPAWDDDSFDWSAMDACLLRTTWDYYLQRDAFVQWAEQVSNQTRLFNPSSIVRWNSDKHYLQDLEALGIPVIPTRWLKQGASIDLRAAMEEEGWSRAFLKPVFGATAHRTLRLDLAASDLEEAQRFLDHCLTEHAMMLQPYLSSVETHGEESLLLFGGRYSHSVRKIPVPGDYRVQDDWGARDEPWQHSVSEIEQATEYVRRIEAFLGLIPGGLLYARLDGLRDDDGQWRLCEFEAIEPSLFLRHHPPAAGYLASLLLARLE